MRLKSLVPVIGLLGAVCGFACGALAVEGENQNQNQNQNASPQKAATQNAAGKGQAAEAGAKLFADSGCGWCHEEGGKVAGKGPKLEGTTRDDHFIKYRITHGKEGAMPSFGHQFNDQQIAELIAYIRSLKD
jgi:mono/diheme cytochrome c family protein